MAAIRLARSPLAAIGRWWDRRCVNARIRWAEGDLEWVRRQQIRDAFREELLRAHIAELRVERALLEP